MPGPRPDERVLRWASGILVGFLVIGTALVVASWWSHRDDSDRGTTRVPARSTPTPTVDTVTPSPTSSPSGPMTKAAMTAFVRDYLTTVTSDPGRAWQLCTPAFQQASGGYGAYVAFWGGIRRARPSGVFADPAARRITYTVTYTHDDGRVDTDSTRLELVLQDGRYLVAGEG